MKGWKQIYHANGDQKKAGVAILISDKILQNKNCYKRCGERAPPMAKVSYLQIITLNVNGLNAPSKRQRLAKWNTKTKPLYMLSTRDPPQNKGHIQTESERLEKRYFMQMKTKRKQEKQY